MTEELSFEEFLARLDTKNGQATPAPNQSTEPAPVTPEPIQSTEAAPVNLEQPMHEPMEVDPEAAQVEEQIRTKFGDKYLEAAKKAAEKIAKPESGGDDEAANKAGSSAMGRFQFTNSTWDSVVKEAGLPYTREDRTDPRKAGIVMMYFTAKNGKVIEDKLGRPAKGPGELYVAHFLGESGGPALIKAAEANPEGSATRNRPREVLEQNAPYFYKDAGKSATRVVDGKTVTYWPEAATPRTNKELYDFLVNRGGGISETPTEQGAARWHPPMALPEEVATAEQEDGVSVGIDGTPQEGVNTEELKQEVEELKKPTAIAEKLKEIEELRLDMTEPQRTNFDAAVQKLNAEYREEIKSLNRQEAFMALGLAVAQLVAVAYAAKRGADLTGVQLMTNFPSMKEQREQAGLDFRSGLGDLRSQQDREDRLIREQRGEAMDEFKFRRGLKQDELEELRRQEREKVRQEFEAQQKEEQRKWQESQKGEERRWREAQSRSDRAFRALQGQLDRDLRRELAASKSTGADKKANHLQEAQRLATEFELAEDDKAKEKIWSTMRKHMIAGGMDSTLVDQATVKVEEGWLWDTTEKTAPKKAAVAAPATSEAATSISPLEAQIKQQHPDWDADKVRRAAEFLRAKQQK
jgi:hypothetical protein